MNVVLLISHSAYLRHKSDGCCRKNGIAVCGLVGQSQPQLFIYRLVKQHTVASNTELDVGLNTCNLLSLRITPVIWPGGIYQEPIIPDYEEFSALALFSLY